MKKSSLITINKIVFILSLSSLFIAFPPLLPLDFSFGGKCGTLFSIGKSSKTNNSASDTNTTNTESQNAAQKTGA